MKFVRDTDPSTTPAVVERTAEEKQGIWLVEDNKGQWEDGSPFRVLVAFSPEQNIWLNVRNGFALEPTKFIKRVQKIR